MQKPLQLSFKNIEGSDAMKAMVRDRVDRLDRLYPNLSGCRVVIEAPHRPARGGARPPLGIAVEAEIPGKPKIVVKDMEERRNSRDQAAVVNRSFDVVERKLDEASNIAQGEVKTHEAAGETGTITRLFPEQSYGFVEAKAAGSLYFTRNAVVDGRFDELAVGMMVHLTRATGEGPMGPQASSIRLLGADRSSE
ncbi:HPF/RaiA family ribosome-associated protein [Inquilinus sp. Marseille-Q2685]|uniref:HPF/RaiA family ribosome-associated protein n=1 Tax=Inquilinus sp. Marseille-Q2685 TaxID=2866581 RepID=UPI001CE496AB|nr:HPF/RaiA family ribosome-associated protein [Inquilinus sp. Marseille-Q2685]